MHRNWQGMDEQYTGSARRSGTAKPSELLVKVSLTYFASQYRSTLTLVSLIAVHLLRHSVQLPGIDFVDDDSAAVKCSYGVVTTGHYHAKPADTLQIGPDEAEFVASFAFAVSQHRCFEREMDGLTAKVAF